MVLQYSEHSFLFKEKTAEAILMKTIKYALMEPIELVPNIR